MKKEGVIKGFGSYAKYYFVAIFIILIIVFVYYYLFFNFRTGNFVYQKNSDILGEVSGISLLKLGYLVYWIDGTYTEEFFLNLERAEQIKETNFSQNDNQNKTQSYLPLASLENTNFSKTLFNELLREKIDDSELIYGQISNIKSGFCLPHLRCGTWSDCQINYNLEAVIDMGEIGGQEYKYCTDLNKCMPDIIGSRACLSKVNITVSRAFWCGKEYIEVKDGFGKVLTRLDTKNRTDYMDISINFGGDYCDYCSDGEMNYDEIGLDCGGSCPVCVKNGG